MAARGLFAPFHSHYKITEAAALVPSCISWLGKTSLRRRRRHARFFCSHRRPPETDMSNYRIQFAQKMAMAGLNPNHRIDKVYTQLHNYRWLVDGDRWWKRLHNHRWLVAGKRNKKWGQKLKKKKNLRTKFQITKK